MKTVYRIGCAALLLVLAGWLPVQAQFTTHVPANRKLYVGRAELWRWHTAYTPLFNGATLDGWEVRGTAQWSVENGALVGRPAPDNPRNAGVIVSTKQYANFILRFRFSIEPDPGVDPDDYVDSGVFFRVPPGAKRADLEGYEMELPAHDGVEEPVGSIRLLARAYPGLSHFNFWNDAEIHCVGDHLRVTVNGQIAAETFDRRSLRGFIMFQHRKQNGVVRFRDIDIQVLPDTPDLPPTIEEALTSAPGQFVPLFNGRDLTGWSTPPPNRSKWHVEDGCITLSEGAGSGNLVHEGEYTDFILRLKFFMPDDGVTRDGNSGIFVRGKGDGANNGPEVQIENVRDHSHWNPTGSIYNYSQAVFGWHKYNDWNEYVIYVKGDRMAAYLNGHKAAAAYLVEDVPAAYAQTVPGHIKIQSHAPYKKLQLKDIEIKAVR